MKKTYYQHNQHEHMKTDDQLKKGFNIYGSEESHTIFITFFHNETETEDNIRATELVIAESRALLDAQGDGPYNAIVDTVAIPDGVRIVVPESRKRYAELIEDARVHRVAFLGTNDFVASLIGTIGELTNHPTKVKWFSDTEEAKNWLKE